MESKTPSFMVPIGLLLLATHAGAQVEAQWAHLHDGAAMQDDFANAVAVDASGNSFVTGRSFDATTGFPPLPPTQDIETVAYGPTGTQLWSARYDLAGGDDVGYAIAVSPQGEVYVAGQSAGGSPFVTQQTVIKYALSGTQLWAHQYGNTAGPNVVRSMLVDAQGNVFLGGQDGGTNASGDMCVRKLDPSGNVIWTATYDGVAHGSDYVYKIAFAPNGDILAAGNTTSPNTNTTDSAVIRVSASGTVLWGREFGLAGQNDNSFDVAVDANGIAYAAGYTSTPAEAQNMSLLAYDAAGTFLWWVEHDGGAHGNDVFRNVAVDSLGRIITTGGGSYNVNNGMDWVIYAYDSGGGTIWDEEFDGQAHMNDTARSLAIDANNNIYVAGYSNTSATTTEGVVVQYDPAGHQRFTYHYAASPLGDQFVAMVRHGDDFVLAGYENTGTSSGYDYVTVRLGPSAVPFCFGDGSGTACPCGNTSPVPATGCSTSLGTGGQLTGEGAASLSGDTLVLVGESMPSSACLYFQGTTMTNGGAGSSFGDGLRCAGGTIVRLGTKQNVSGESEYPRPGDPAVSVRGGIGSPGDRTYQAWFRNAAAFCTPSTFNLSNGLRVTWSP